MAIKNLTGHRFGKLTVLSAAEPKVVGKKRERRSTWLCRCDCGTVLVILDNSLKMGARSCGCARRDWQNINGNGCRKHGHKMSAGASPTYGSWVDMLRRCRRPTHKYWKHYGGRGIRVCERWMKFENFLADMGERPTGKTLDRKDTNGHYEPGNCRWATAAEQSQNRRTAILLEFEGERLPLLEWCRRKGLTEATVRLRLRRGWPVERALTTPQFSSRREERGIPGCATVEV